MHLWHRFLPLCPLGSSPGPLSKPLCWAVSHSFTHCPCLSWPLPPLSSCSGNMGLGREEAAKAHSCPCQRLAPPQTQHLLSRGSLSACQQLLPGGSSTLTAILMSSGRTEHSGPWALTAQHTLFWLDTNRKTGWACLLCWHWPQEHLVLEAGDTCRRGMI